LWKNDQQNYLTSALNRSIEKFALKRFEQPHPIDRLLPSPARAASCLQQAEGFSGREKNSQAVRSVATRKKKRPAHIG
jgi:hypothetical protein